MPTVELDHPEHLLLALLALPLAALFVARRRPVAWRTGYAFLWAQLATGGTARRSSRYQDVARWAWQVGLLVLVALVAAGPATAGRRGPYRQVLAIDTSASMGARASGMGPTRLARGLDLAGEWLRDETATTLIAGAPWPRIVVADAPPEVARTALARLAPDLASLDTDAFIRVISLTSSGADEVVVVSDACGDGGFDLEARLPAKAGWIAPGRGDLCSNLGLGHTVAMPNERDRGWRVVTDVVNGGSQTATAAVWVVGYPATAREVELAPGEGRPVAIELPAGITGELELAVTGVDDLGADDRVTIALRGVPRAAITLVSERRVGGELRPSPFWARALEALGDRIDRGASRVAASLSDLGPSPDGANAFHLTILDDVRLRGPLPPGNYLLFGVRGGPVPPAGPAVADLGAWQVDHDAPLLRAVELADLLVRRGCALRAERDDHVLATSAHGPLVVAGARPGIRFIAFGFALADSNLYALAAFPLLLRNAIEELGRARDLAVYAAIDRGRARELVEGAVAGGAAWRRPGGAFEPIVPGELPPGVGWLRVGTVVAGVDGGLGAEGRLVVPPGRPTPTPLSIGPARHELGAPIAWAALAWLLVGLLVPRLWPRDLRS